MSASTSNNSPFDPELTEQRIEELVGIGDHYGVLIHGKSLNEMLKPGVYLQGSELFVRSLIAKLAERKYDLDMAIIMAIAWGIYVAELKQTMMLEVGELTEIQ